jgi:Mce-associated membrane protein
MMPAALRRRAQREESEDAVRVDTDEVIETADESTQSDSTDVLEAPSDAKEDADEDGRPHDRRGGIQWRRILTYGVLPILALIMAMTAGYLKWYDSSARDSRLAAGESVRAASEGAVAMLSYRPDTVDKDLGAARDRLTGALKDSYSSLTHDVVIPGSKQKMISATASVPAAASVSASPNHAVVLMFVNQTIIVGNDPPTNTASRIRVTLEKVDSRWLISSFDPI